MLHNLTLVQCESVVTSIYCSFAFKSVYHGWSYNIIELHSNGVNATNYIISICKQESTTR